MTEVGNFSAKHVHNTTLLSVDWIAPADPKCFKPWFGSWFDVWCSVLDKILVLSKKCCEIEMYDVAGAKPKHLVDLLRDVLVTG
jgi:hypothetical protein